MRNIGDLRDFNSYLQRRGAEVRTRLRDALAGHRLTLAEARRHRVLMPMVGVYTPGWQALPAVSWEFIELVTHQGPVGTGEWSVRLDPAAVGALAMLAATPEKNLLDADLEGPLFMAWWDLVGQVLGKPLHQLWAELFEVGFDPPGEVPLAAYSWQRFPDADGKDAVTVNNWAAFAQRQVDEGYRTLKVSMTSYDPEVYIEVLSDIRRTIPRDIDIRIDTHGSWNFVEARRLLPKLNELDISYLEQPMNALLPSRFYADGRSPPADGGGGYQREYYFRKLEELRRHTTIPFSCHWWTPPILQPRGKAQNSNAWSFDWHMIERYDPVDIAVPDIGLGVFGLWRLLQMARFMGLHVTIHSNFELGLQSRFRGMMFSALGYYPEVAGIYLGTSPRLCLAMDTEYNQIRDDVLEGGKLAIRGGNLPLGDDVGHGLRLDPARLQHYRFTEAAVTPYREQACRIYENYLLDRPRRNTMSGWSKEPGPERMGRHVYPYDVTNILGLDQKQDVDVELNT